MNLARCIAAITLVLLQYGCTSTPTPLSAPPGSSAIAVRHNAEGITHYEMGHWPDARTHFTSAIEADPNLAESHFNLALTLDKLGLHAEATAHFKRAAELAPANPAIVHSSAYRSHTAPPSPSSYGPGGYGGIGGY